MLPCRQLAALSALLAMMVPASAGEWPEKPVKIIYPYAAGSTGDVTARLIARRLGDKLGQPFIVENRAGANGVIAAEAVARSAPDGHTLLWAITPQIAISPVMTKVPYDPVTDFAPTSLTPSRMRKAGQAAYHILLWCFFSTAWASKERM